MRMLLAALALLVAVPQAEAPGPEPILDNNEFMALLQKPAYAELRDALAKPPEDRRNWTLVYQRAVRLAELQNLLFIRNRTGATDPRWKAAAAGTRHAATDVANLAAFALRNVETADYDAVRKKYVAIADACNVCHRTFAREAPTIRP